MTGIDAGAARSALEWWRDAGVDVITADDASSWLELQAKPVAAAAAASVVAEPQVTVQAAATLEEFREMLADRSKRLGGMHVEPVGAADAPIMILGDRPDRTDCAEGIPFGGEAGAMIGRMLSALSIDVDYRALLEPCHRAGARIEASGLDELAKLARQHITFVRPKLLLLFGDAAAQALIGKPLPKARGHVHHVEGVRTVVTFHPRWLLQRPGDKALAWADLLLLTAQE